MSIRALVPLDDTQVAVAIASIKAVAESDGAIDETEVRLIHAVGAALETEVDVDAIVTATPEEAAAAFPDAIARERLVQALLVTAMTDGEVVDAEVKTIQRFAKALGVAEPRVASLRKMAHGHLSVMKFEVLRRADIVWDPAKFAWEHDGFKGLYRYFGAFAGVATNPETAWRYRQLGLLPENTLGRTYWAHMTSRRFGFPGEVKGFPELQVRHDMCHVLGGYDTDAPGEVDVISFIAGFKKEDPFSYLFMILLQEHMGMQVFYPDPVARFQFDPARALRALERGMNVKADLYETGFDFWPYMDRPIDEVRAELGIA